MFALWLAIGMLAIFVCLSIGISLRALFLAASLHKKEASGE